MQTRTLKKLSVFGAVALVLAAFLLGRCSVGHDDRDAHEHEHSVEEGEEVEYVCPMHPQIRQPEFGTCPICFMDLVPVEAGGKDQANVEIRMGETARALASVETERVQLAPAVRSRKVFGRVAINETSEIDITSWVAGRIDRLYVTAVGTRVRRGQRLARIYSPELLLAQQTLLQAVQDLGPSAPVEGHENRPVESTRQRAAASAVEAMKYQMRLKGIDENQIQEIISTGTAQESLEIFATASGTVQRRWVSEGDWVDTGSRILSLVALDTIWVQLEIFEDDLAWIATEQNVRIRIPALSEEFEGRISFIDPTLDERTRVARARVAIDSRGGKIRPGMFVEAVIEAPMEDDVLTVAESAVLWTGPRSMVYRRIPGGDHTFEPVEVLLGPKLDDRRVILDGLQAGDEVVRKGAFRIDAAMQIRGGPSMMTRVVEDPAQREDLPPVEVPAEGVEFAPPVMPEQLPQDIWYCDMGSVHWAQGDEKDRRCPLCNMFLTYNGELDEGHDHEH